MRTGDFVTQTATSGGIARRALGSLDHLCHFETLGPEAYSHVAERAHDLARGGWSVREIVAELTR